MIEKICHCRLNNGQWRLEIIAPKGTRLPAEGLLMYLGQRAWTVKYEFSPGPTREWIMIAADADVISGGRVIARMRVQPDRVYTILLLTEHATVCYYGHRRRRERIKHYMCGRVVHVDWSDCSKEVA